jgi:hypothetical protein
LKDIRRLDNGGSHSTNEMEIDVAVKEPDTRVIGSETNYNVAICGDKDTVTLQWHAWKRAFVAIP